MAEIVVHNALIVFEPAADWQWRSRAGTGSWDGTLEIRAESRAVQIDGRNVAIAEDFRNLSERLVGQGYVAKGFDDTPGTVVSATVFVDEATLATHFDEDGSRIAKRSTSGTFVVGCSPSFKSGSPPIADPMAQRKTGRWSVKDPGQTIVSSD